jgi:coenzyme Q-binding protein COQ10
MPVIVKEKDFKVSAEQLLKVIVDVEKYPLFVPGVSSLKILEKKESSIKALYGLNIIKSFEYTIEMDLSVDMSVKWKLLSGDLFKKNDGAWIIKPKSKNSCHVTYELDVEFKIFAPGMIVTKLVNSNLPEMLSAFEKRAQSV